MKKNIDYESISESINKGEAFDEIAKLFYYRNFSTVSKSEIDLIMFHFYMKALLTKYADENGVLDYDTCSDYEISKQLGITQERVRNLKIKSQARYPEPFDWKKSFQSLEDKIRYDEQKKRIIIPISDPNLYIEIKNYIEENGGYVEVQRSGNYLQIRPEYYLFLLFDSSDEQDRKKILKEVTKKLNKRNLSTPISIESKAEMVSHILGIAENSLSILASLIDSIDSPLAIALRGLKGTFERILQFANTK